MKGNVNPQQAFYQVTWVTGIIYLCYLAVTHLSTSYPEILSAIFPDITVNLLMAVLKNIDTPVNVVKGTSFPSVFVWFANCHCTEWAPSCIRKKYNKRDFVFALAFAVFSVFVASSISMTKGGWIWEYIFSFSYNGLKNRLECLDVGHRYFRHITLHGFLNEATGMVLRDWQLVWVDGRISKILFRLCLWRSTRDEQIVKAAA